MKYKLTTKIINNLEYVVSCTSIFENDMKNVDPKYLIDSPIDVANNDNRLCYVLKNDMLLFIPQEYNVKEMSKIVRTKRDRLIDEIDWRLNRYERQERLGIETNDSIEWYEWALNYVQQLRDIPEQEGFPFDVVFPDSEVNYEI